ncbi:hypothetical protein FM107_16620 [Sphingobacterium sp. JB170]|nr:hypothetical protein FM107_16620 [Sphingobacterium sp. JB170]
MKRDYFDKQHSKLMNNNLIGNRSGSNYPNKRIISLWFMRLLLSYYKFKNRSQNINRICPMANVVILE